MADKIDTTLVSQTPYMIPDCGCGDKECLGPETRTMAELEALLQVFLNSDTDSFPSNPTRQQPMPAVASRFGYDTNMLYV